MCNIDELVSAASLAKTSLDQTQLVELDRLLSTLKRDFNGAGTRALQNSDADKLYRAVLQTSKIVDQLIENKDH